MSRPSRGGPAAAAADEPARGQMEDANNHRLFEAPNVYRLTDSGTYLLMIEAIGNDGKRWFRSWTAPAITGPWQPLAAEESTPFARSNNITFNGAAWTQDISHGELIRAGTDQTLDLNHAINDSHWFVRSTPTPTVAFSWAFFEEFPLPPDASFAYRYRIVVADGAWDRDRVATQLAALPW